MNKIDYVNELVKLMSNTGAQAAIDKRIEEESKGCFLSPVKVDKIKVDAFEKYLEKLNYDAVKIGIFGYEKGYKDAANILKSTMPDRKELMRIFQYGK